MNNPLLEPRNDLSDLPSPGEIIIYDYTENRNLKESECEETKKFKVKAIQWNIERAYKLDEIINLLSKESTDGKDFRASYKSKITRKSRGGDALYYKDFDVFAIQEFDINCARSNYRNSPQELARALNMKCIFLCEFEEIYSSKLRNKRSQGGGVHGNGILTWWDVERVDVIDHVEIFNWERDGEKLGEPRRGIRRSLAAFLRHPLHPDRKMIVYSVHLEVFCGIFGRLRQFSQIIHHSRSNIQTHPHQMILGDLNTMAHGLARFLPKYCCDGMRWRSVGWSEAEWWQRNLFSVTPSISGQGDHESLNYFLAAHHHPRKPVDSEFEQEIENELDESVDNKNENFRIPFLQPISPPPPPSPSIFSKFELMNLINPYFFCPFPVSRTKTVEMHGYSGKLDWMLLRSWRVNRFGFDNETYGRSDHKLLWCEVEEFVSGDGDPGKEAHDNYFSVNGNTPGEQIPFSSSLMSRSQCRFFIGAGLIGISGALIYYILKK